MVKLGVNFFLLFDFWVKMLEHIKIVGVFLILIYGTVSLIYSWNSSRQHPDKILKYLSLYFFAFNLTMFITLLRKYFQVNIHDNSLYPLVLEISLDIVFIFIYLMVTSVYSIGGLLSGYFNSKKNKNINSVIISVIVLATLIKYISGNQNSNYSLYFNQTADFCALLFNIIIFVITGYALYISRRTDNPAKKNIIYWFGIYFIIPFLSYTILKTPPLGSYFAKFEIFSTFSSLIILFSHVFFPFLWLIKVYLNKENNSLQIVQQVDTFQNIYTEHNISEREKEIICLILEGKSNKEIEGQLFISSHTVKNHLYKIYQKLGINSRFQLISLFKNNGASRTSATD